MDESLPEAAFPLWARSPCATLELSGIIATFQFVSEASLSTMLVISRTQMQVMTEQAVCQFVEALADELPREHPWLVLGRSRADLVELCRRFVDKGRDLGLAHRADLHGFVVVSLLVGPDFHKHPAIAEALRGNDVADGRKMYVVTSALLEARQTGEHQS